MVNPSWLRRALLAVLMVALPAVFVAGGSPATAASTGLVAAYSFDEGSGTLVHDVSGNGNDATVRNASFTTAGKYGGAVSLNGTSSTVTVADNSSLDLTSGMTLEAWVRPSSFSSSQTLIAKERAGGGFPYGLELDGGVASGYATTGTFGRASGSAALATSTWAFVATTYDGSTLRTYVNGTLVGSSALSGAIATSSGQLTIGADSVWGEYFAGRIDNVRIYNRALGASALTTDMNTAVAAPPASAPTPVAAYAFDEGSGMTASDSSGLGNTATLNGAAWTSSGKYNAAVTFNGSSIVAAADSSSLDATSGLALEAWVKPTAFAASQTVLAKEQPGGGFPYGLELDNGVPSAYATTTAGATPRASAPSALPLNTWSFVAAVYNGSTLTLYVNGSVVSSAAASGTLATSSGTLSIGADSQWGEYFSGTIDNVRVYSAPLSAAQVSSDMSTAIAGGAPPPPPPPSGDTTPPSGPTGLTTSGVTQTAMTLGWTASTDNVGVAGYEVYLNGAKQGATTATTYALSGLSCGTSYTLGVDAYDAAGNVSTRTSISAATSSCPTSGTTANLWIDKSGGSCTRSASPVGWSDSTACGSFQAALNAAQAGDTILVTCNSGTSCTYPPETLSNSKGSSSSRITVAAAPGYTVGFEESSGSGTPVWLRELHNVNLTNIGFGQNNVGNGSSFDGNLRIDCSTNVILTNSTGRRFHIFEGNSNFVFKGGTWGGYGTGGEEDSSIGTTGAYGPGETCAGQSAPQPTSITFDGVTWHDVFWNETTSQWGGSHPDCFEINGYTNNVTIENGQIYHCGNTFLSVYGNQGFNHNLTIQNMNFHDLGNDTWYGIAIHGGGLDATDQKCGNLVFQNNTYTPNNPNASGPYSGLYVQCAPDSGYARTLVTGNTFNAIENHGSSDGTCETSQGSPYYTQWISNTWLRGTPCGS